MKMQVLTIFHNYANVRYICVKGFTMLIETSKKIKAKQAIFGSKNRIKTFGVMSPENPNAETATKEQNEAYYTEFKKMLQKDHVHFYPVLGKYKNFEHSFMLFNVSLEDMKYYSKTFGQQAFVFALVNDETVTFQMWSRTTQKSPYVLDDEVSNVNVYQYRDKEKDDYFTKIANNFFYSIPFFETCVHEFNDLLNERIEKSEPYSKQFDYLLDCSLSDSRTPFGRYLSRVRLYNDKWKHLAEIHSDDVLDNDIEQIYENAGMQTK